MKLPQRGLSLERQLTQNRHALIDDISHPGTVTAIVAKFKATN
jgi:hypothetical protein